MDRSLVRSETFVMREGPPRPDTAGSFEPQASRDNPGVQIYKSTSRTHAEGGRNPNATEGSVPYSD